jgi:hypothetical protein
MTQTSWLMLSSETTTTCSEKHTMPIKIASMGKTGVLMLKKDVTYSIPILSLYRIKLVNTANTKNLTEMQAGE